MTMANRITIFRILLVPFFVLQVLYYIHDGSEFHRLLALLTFGLAAISDGIDGYVARRYNQRSELGSILDPLADKMLLLSGVVLLSLDTHGAFASLPIWLTTVIISRDALLIMGLVVIHFTVGKATVRPHFIGKVATVAQMVSVIWVLLKWDTFWLGVWVWVAGICTGISGIIYIVAGVRQLGASPSSAATKGC